MKIWVMSALIVAGVFAGEIERNQAKLESIQELRSFAIGSCNKLTRPQPMWKYILAQKPQLFIWGGDNIYANTESVQLIKEKYAQQDAKPGYKQIKENMAIIGTWDDHDYGQNDGGIYNPIKKESQELFLDFVKEPKNSLRRQQEGIYTSYSFGPPEREVKVIILDNRYFLGDMTSGREDILGVQQWTWLENLLATSTAKIHFIVTGLSVLSPKIPITEDWRDFPYAYQKMINLLNKHNPSGVVFLTGDKHFSSIWQRQGHLEFMSSGLTHTVPLIALRKYIGRFYPISYFGLNYGMVNIDWLDGIPEIQLDIRARAERPIFTRKYRLAPNKQWQRVF